MNYKPIDTSAFRQRRELGPLLQVTGLQLCPMTSVSQKPGQDPRIPWSWFQLPTAAQAKRGHSSGHGTNDLGSEGHDQTHCRLRAPLRVSAPLSSLPLPLTPPPPSTPPLLFVNIRHSRGFLPEFSSSSVQLK